ncbi:FACT complex subunit SSRP1 [Glycine soja]|uniref:FACT complex subunit SSRP1 n=1 Tax=Glycine soja TaxID=3848 RepID=A0A0B2R9L6_GLYSO|nr:FACT complex subunit SSRP1 [Glycine soja]
MEDSQKHLPKRVTSTGMHNAVAAVDPLGELVKNLFDAYQKPIELPWDGAKFGYLMLKMAFSSHMQMFMNDWSTSLEYGPLHGFLEPQSIHKAKDRRQECQQYIQTRVKESQRLVYLGAYLNHYAVKSSLKAEDGILYPLKKSFFFLPKPLTLILHEEIDYVEFERHVAGGSNMHYFDLSIRLKSEQEHLCCNIQRNEYHNLYEFIRRCLTYCWYKEGSLFEDDDVVDPHLERIKNEAGGDESDEEKPAKKESKKDMPSKASTSKRKSKDDEDGKKKKRLKCTQEDNVWFHVHF